jgi:hypothetical protein
MGARIVRGGVLTGEGVTGTVVREAPGVETGIRVERGDGTAVPVGPGEGVVLGVDVRLAVGVSESSGVGVSVSVGVGLATTRTVSTQVAGIGSAELSKVGLGPSDWSPNDKPMTRRTIIAGTEAAERSGFIVRAV